MIYTTSNSVGEFIPILELIAFLIHFHLLEIKLIPRAVCRVRE